MRLAQKDYQAESLDVLQRYAEAVREKTDAKVSFPESNAYREITERDYYTTPHFNHVPYVCLRIPTGGGKTLMAAHAVGRIARHLLRIDNPACLWVTPSTTIRDQTRNGLQNSHHPYRLALEEELGTSIEVLTLEEALTKPQYLRVGGPAVVIVTTIQSYRIRGEKDGEPLETTRKIYDDNGYMAAPLGNLPREILRTLTADENGLVQLSLANALRVRQPIVIMDEAHNARTPTSFESLARFGPSFVLEMTATPTREHNPTDPTSPSFASNVLHSVSALALKNEGMIKLPVELESRGDALEVLAATKQRREQLEWKFETDLPEPGIRPIALIAAQAASKNKETFTPDWVKTQLIETLKVPEEEIAVCYGSTDELAGIDITATQCSINYVITVNKLREGWDCPWAYVLGAIGNTATSTAVEQLIGRILRMPNAMPTNVPALDRAYAFVLSDDVVKTAMKLRDKMVETCGFDERSADDALRVKVTPRQPNLGLDRMKLSKPPEPEQMPPSLAGKVHWEPESSELVFNAAPTAAEMRQLQVKVATEEDKAAVDTYWNDNKPVGVSPRSLGDFAKPVSVPRLVVRRNAQRSLLEPIELDTFSWNMDDCPAEIGAADFASTMRVGTGASIDIEDRGKFGASLQAELTGEIRLRQLELIETTSDWSAVEAVRWLDRDIHRGGSFAALPAKLSQPWLLRVVQHLTDVRGITLPMLVRRRHELATVVRTMIADHAREQLRKATNLLFEKHPESVQTDDEFALTIEEDAYFPGELYEGGFKFKKHAFEDIGKMNGEETECAIRIDGHENVRRWLRNAERATQGGFSLPKSPGRFYPDFIVELNDGRIVLVEYKNSKLASHPDEQQKKDIGELWAMRSESGHRFGWIVDKEWNALTSVLEADD
jgi:type III restriction enzyme